MSSKKLIVIAIFSVLILTCCVKPDEPARKDVVINEVLPVNKTIAADQNGQYDDWIELYNKSASAKDISGYYLSDNKDKREKWRIPAGATVPGNGYLIIWTDGDTLQAGLHANFKLSSAGEDLVFTSPNGTLLDELTYPAQTQEISYSRNPDGTGSFRWQAPTFNSSNDIE
jgi:hypothetical protein